MNISVLFVVAKDDEWYHIDAIEDPLEEADEFYEATDIHEDHENARNHRLENIFLDLANKCKTKTKLMLFSCQIY
jgi:hypothetical protein